MPPFGFLEPLQGGTKARSDKIELLISFFTDKRGYRPSQERKLGMVVLISDKFV
jgi:hypothetical protein